MQEKTRQRWRGLHALVRDGVESGSRAIETLQIEAMRRPCAILERVPPLATPVKGVRAVHDHVVSAVHGSIRLVNQVAGEVLEHALADRPRAAPGARVEDGV